MKDSVGVNTSGSKAMTYLFSGPNWSGGNFINFGLPGADLQRKKPCPLRDFVGIPYSTEQGIILAEQGIFSE